MGGQGGEGHTGAVDSVMTPTSAQRTIDKARRSGEARRCRDGDHTGQDGLSGFALSKWGLAWGHGRSRRAGVLRQGTQRR
jgi:hypothetical protein